MENDLEVNDPDDQISVVVPEVDRFCRDCGAEVGRAVVDGALGRVKGFCGECRAEYDFGVEVPVQQDVMIAADVSTVSRIQHLLGRLDRLVDMNIVRTMQLLIVAAASIASIGAAFDSFLDPAVSASSQTLQGKIETLSLSLETTAQDIAAIEIEIEARRQLVEQLEQDAAAYESLVRLNEDEVRAIVSQLEGVVDESSKGSNQLTIIWAILGAIFSVLFGFLLGEVPAVKNRRGRGNN